MAETYTVLGIETSCDETAAAVVEGRPGGTPKIRSNIIHSQLDDHSAYGGVVPEIAARAHIDLLDGIIAQALDEASSTFTDLDAVAVTAGPGLIGGVMVGLMTAKGICAATGLPLIGVNHLEGHALSPRLIEPISFPYLLLLVSGGHCQMLAVCGPGDYTRYGTTVDDAIGEAFDKTAKLLGLPYPGGPSIERAARNGNPSRFDFPRPFRKRPHCHFSFSGLKTAVARAAANIEEPNTQDQADIAASFQMAVTDVLEDRLGNAMSQFREEFPRDAHRVVIAGGVAANQNIRQRVTELALQYSFDVTVPPPNLCTDNGAMIAWAGLERMALGETDALDLAARARWPLDPEAPPAIGAGVKA